MKVKILDDTLLGNKMRLSLMIRSFDSIYWLPTLLLFRLPFRPFASIAHWHGEKRSQQIIRTAYQQKQPVRGDERHRTENGKQQSEGPWSDLFSNRYLFFDFETTQLLRNFKGVRRGRIALWVRIVRKSRKYHRPHRRKADCNSHVRCHSHPQTRAGKNHFFWAVAKWFILLMQKTTKKPLFFYYSKFFWFYAIVKANCAVVSVCCAMMMMISPSNRTKNDHYVDNFKKITMRFALY